MSVVAPLQAVDLDDVSPSDAEEDEERQVGAVSWQVYKEYSQATGNLIWLIVSAALLILTQMVSVLNSLFLGWWSSSEFGLEQYQYMVIYACKSTRY